MDPLSIAASVVGLLGATVKVSTVLNNFVQGLRNVPNVANGVLHEVSDISTCLAQLQGFLMGTRVGSRSRAALLMVEHVIVILTSCVMTFSELEEILESLKDDRWSKRIIWLLREPKLEKICQRLNSSKISLNLMLTALTCASVDQATTSVEALTDLVEQVLQTNQDLCVRLRNLESLPSHPTIRSATSLNEHDKEDSASTIRTMRFASDPMSEASDNGIFDVRRFTFDRDLGQSRVYKRVSHRHSLASLSSSAAPSFGWSCFSKMSLANVSNMSVISLPVAVDELSNGEHYREPSIPPNISTQVINSAALSERPRLIYHDERTIGRRSPYLGRKIVIIWASLSGKTTVSRQIQAMYGYSFSEAQRNYFLAVILDNVITASALISSHVRASRFAMSAEARENLAALSSLHSVRRDVSYDHATVVGYMKAFRSLMKIPAILRLMPLWDLKGVHDNVRFLCHHFESLLIKDCTAANSDIFHSRSGPTTAPKRHPIRLGSTPIQLIDWGGSYSEQTSTWGLSHSTGDIIIFTVALSGYCRYALDNSKQNQMLDAMEVFRKVSAAVRLPIILLFTKIDVLENLLATHRFTKYFPGYSGPLDSYSICGYLASRFRQLRPGTNKTLFIRTVNAADPEVFRKFFEEIESQILQPKPSSTACILNNDFLQVKEPSPLTNSARRLRASQKIPDMDRPLITGGDDGDDDDDDDDPSLYGYDDYDEDPPLNDGVETEYNDDDDDRSIQLRVHGMYRY